MTIEDGTHSGSRNVVGKFTLHTVQNAENQKLMYIPRWKSKIKIQNVMSKCTKTESHFHIPL